MHYPKISSKIRRECLSNRLILFPWSPPCHKQLVRISWFRITQSVLYEPIQTLATQTVWTLSGSDNPVLTKSLRNKIWNVKSFKWSKYFNFDPLALLKNVFEIEKRKLPNRLEISSANHQLVNLEAEIFLDNCKLQYHY